MQRKHFQILVILAALARLPLMFGDLWYDENYTLILARLPLDAMMKATMGDVHPPLWYFIVYPFAHWGGPAWLIRVPAFICSILAIFVLRAVMEKLNFSVRAQWIGLILMAIAPMQLQYGTEGRMYALMELLVLGGVWCVLVEDWKNLTPVCIALVYLQNWGLFYSAALGLFALLQTRNIKLVLKIFSRVFVAWLPWLIVILWQMRHINRSYWVTHISFGTTAYHIYEQLFSAFVDNPIALIIYFAWFILGCFLLKDYRVMIMIFVPVLLAVIVSVLWQPVTIFRAYIGISPFIYVMLAKPFDKVNNLRNAIFVSIFIIPFFVTALINIYTSTFREGSLTSLNYINDHWQPGDVIVALNDEAVINIMPYTDKPIILLIPCEEALGALSMPTRSAMGYLIANYSNIYSDRVWLVWGKSPLIKQCEKETAVTITKNASPEFIGSESDWGSTEVWLIHNEK